MYEFMNVSCRDNGHLVSSKPYLHSEPKYTLLTILMTFKCCLLIGSSISVHFPHRFLVFHLDIIYLVFR